jgi:SAM-dependent methyltransferase
MGQDVARIDGWLGTGTGAALVATEVAEVAVALESVFGDEFLQLGCWGSPELFRGLARTRRRAVVSPVPEAGVDLVSALHDLAIGGDCIDAVLLPHTLETVDDPHAVLREVDRVLRPDGQIVLLGFNPLGWWGARHYLSRRSFPRGVARMIGDYRVRDWLRLLGFRPQRTRYYHFRAPLYRPGLELPGESPAPADTGSAGWRLRHWPGLAACYVLVARKEQFMATPIRLELRRRTRLVPGLVNPTTRSAA